MSWSKEWKVDAPVAWPVAPIKGWPVNDPENNIDQVTGITPEMLGVKPDVPTLIDSISKASQVIGWDIGRDDKTTIVVASLSDAGIHVEKVYDNKMPTHDPYVNPNSHIYYQCNCGDILDPGTKSFAALNNYASDKGWKVRWNKDGLGYQPFCVGCGKDVE